MSENTAPAGGTGRWLRLYGPHSTWIDRFLWAHIRQFVGGKTWSLCLITNIDRQKWQPQDGGGTDG